MPRFFFHIHDGREIRDQEGTELPSIDEARKQAVRTAGEMLRDHDDFWTGDVWTMNVVDERGITVCVLNFSAG